MSEGRLYRFGRAEHPALVAGIRWQQALVLLGGAALMIAALTGIGARPLAGGAALGIGALAAALAFVPVGGEPVDRWLAVFATRMWRRASGGARYRSPQPRNGHIHPARQPESEAREDLPPALSGVRILAVPHRGAEVGIARQGATWTVVMAAQGGPFALLDREEQERRLAGWGSVLASVARAGSPVSRVQWVERTAGETVDEAGRHLRDGLALPTGHRALASYLQLVEDAGPAARRHELLLALQIDGRRAGRLIKRAGGGESGACAVALREATILIQRLGGAEIEVSGALTPRMLARALRAGFDPVTRPAAPEAGDEDAHTPSAVVAAPSAGEEGWSHYRADSACHAVFWVERWPATGAGADFLAPLLLDGLRQRTVSVVMEPLDPARATRAAERARVREATDEEQRSRFGFMGTARRRQQQEATLRREEEVAEGHAAMRFSAYVGVSASSLGELEDACAGVEHTAQMARLELRRLYGQQAEALGYLLPLCRGLR